MKTRTIRPDRGMTLLEIIIGLGVVVIALLGIMSALASASRLDEVSAEQVKALNACKSVIEQMKQTTFSEIWSRYNANPADDPGGSGTAPGRNFAVTGLRAQPGDGDGMPGQVSFPETANNLSETAANVLFGMPVARDLNGDGDANDTNVNTTYMIIPVRVVVDWQGPRGRSHVEFTTFLFQQ